MSDCKHEEEPRFHLEIDGVRYGVTIDFEKKSPFAKARYSYIVERCHDGEVIADGYQEGRGTKAAILAYGHAVDGAMYYDMDRMLRESDPALQAVER